MEEAANRILMAITSSTHNSFHILVFWWKVGPLRCCAFLGVCGGGRGREKTGKRNGYDGFRQLTAASQPSKVFVRRRFRPHQQSSSHLRKGQGDKNTEFPKWHSMELHHALRRSRWRSCVGRGWRSTMLFARSLSAWSLSSKLTTTPAKMITDVNR